MGMIGTSDGLLARHVQSQAQHREEVTSAEPRPLSHDRHFSVSAQSAHGYRPHVIADIIVFGGSGQIVSVEHPGRRVEARRRKGAMLVPDATLSKGSTPLQFLWGTARSAPSLNGQHPETALEDHLKYKTLHHRVLENVGDIALQAFLRFLERQAPSVINWSTIVGRTRCNLAFRFQYDEHYLHERHAAQLAWKRFLTEGATDAD
jgi:hypothetical protein